MNWALEEIRRKNGVDLRHDDVARARIKLVAEARKRELSAANSAVIDLPFLTPQLSVNLPITRAVFNGLIEPLLQRSLVCLGQAVESAEKTSGVRKDQIEQVLLVGGSSRIPRVRALLAGFFDHLGEKDIRSDINPDEAVSRGAARVALKHYPSDAFEGKEIDLVATGAISEADREDATALVLQDVTSHTLGILVNQQDFSRIIPKESRIPAEVTRDEYVNAGPSRSIDVLIYQGEDDVAFNNALIGKLPIPLPEPKERGYWKFAVTFALDNDGILSILVKRLNDNQTFPLKVQCSVRSPKAHIEEGATHLTQVMAVDATGDDAGMGAPPPPPPAPKRQEPRPEPRPAAAAPPPEPRPEAAAPSSPAAAPVPPPPGTPDEFRSLARRSYKLLDQPLGSEARDRLLTAYNAFVEAVNLNAPNVEELGDALADVYLGCKPAQG
jgi:molecular chaperone DnaK